MPTEVVNFLNKIQSNDKFKLTNDPIYRSPALPDTDIVEPDPVLPVLPLEAPRFEEILPAVFDSSMASVIQSALPVSLTEIRGGDAMDAPDVFDVDVPTQDLYVDAAGVEDDHGRTVRRSRRVNGLAPTNVTDPIPKNLSSSDGFNNAPRFIAMSIEDAEEMAALDFEQFIGLHLSEGRALKKHGSLADEKMLAEVNQLIDDFKAFQPILWHKLTPEELATAINSSMFLKEKYKSTGEFEKLKARLVGGGHLQDRTKYNDVSSPTVSLPNVLLVAAIAAYEERKVITMDIKGAFLNAKMNEEKPVYMWLSPSAVKLILIEHPDWREYMAEDGRILVQLMRALYGTIEASLLWYENINKALIDYGMKPNPSGECVYNYVRNGIQLTVCLYVDDLKITCVSDPMIYDFVLYIRRKYKDTTVHEGGIHNYLGMTFEYGGGVVTVSMLKYTQDIKSKFEPTKGRKWPTTENLFVVDPNSPLLCEKRRKALHSGIMTVRYLSQRVRPETLCAISFLSTRVLKLTEEDEKKFMRVVEYVCVDPAMGITLSVDGKDGINIFSFIDSSFGCHEDFRGQTGGIITIGGGPVMASSLKQSVVAKSSTESELYGISDFSSAVIGVRYFLEAQGYTLDPATVWHDNMSTLALIQKGRPASDRSRHINIRFFFVKERVTAGELRFQYKRTEDMIADILTKPIQGALFLRLRALLLNTARRV